jgi:alpha-N-arabinofuranosidase
MTRQLRALTLTLLLLSASRAVAQAPVRVVIDADLGETTISRYIYGHFGEDLGRNIYDGLWTKAGTGQWHVRDDVIEALKRIQIPTLRWPGGCFADYYHWRDGIGPRDQRPAMVNTVWGGVTEDNSFGTHEYLELIRRLGAAPFIVGNVGSGTVQEMSQWWEYLRAPQGSPLGDERARNGHPEPYDVHFWGVGNESWGCGGSMTAAEYANVYKRYAEFLRGGHPFRIATGPGGDDYAWTDTLMREAGRMIDGIDLHYYTLSGTWQHKGSATQFTEQEWFTAIERALYIDTLITRHSTIMDRYDPGRRVWLIVGEWGMWHDPEPGSQPGFLYQQNALRDAVVAGLHLNIFNEHAARVHMANIAQTVNVLQSMILTQGDQMIVTPTYWVFDMFKVHQDATLLPLHIRSDDYTFNGQSVPAVSASASRDTTGAIHITFVNVDPNRSRTVQADVRGVKVSAVSGRLLTAPTMQAHNTFEDPDAVKPVNFTGARLSGGILHVELPSKSVVVLELR